MTKNLFTVKDLYTEIPGQEIIKGVNLKTNYREVHVIMGPNGLGKSTLANILMNNPQYKVTGEDILLDGEGILGDSTDVRAKKGLFVSFQNPVEVPGLAVESFLRVSNQEINQENVGIIDLHEKLLDYADVLEMDERYLGRYLGVGFSGGRKKENKILQLLTLNPKLAILGETDFGLDAGAVRVVSKGIEEFLSENNSVLIVTHHNETLNNILIDQVRIVMDGEIVKDGDESLVHETEAKGFGWMKDEVGNEQKKGD